VPSIGTSISNRGGAVVAGGSHLNIQPCKRLFRFHLRRRTSFYACSTLVEAHGTFSGLHREARIHNVFGRGFQVQVWFSQSV